MTPKLKAFLVAFAIALGADQATKMWARATLRTGLKIVIPGYFDFRYSENPDAAFSLLHGLPGGRYLILIVGIAALGLLFVWLKNAPADARRLGAILGLIAGGALGNIIDRVTIGRVTDFIFWHVGVHAWPIFNIADAALVVGILGMLASTFFAPDRAKSSPANGPRRNASR